MGRHERPPLLRRAPPQKAPQRIHPQWLGRGARIHDRVHRVFILVRGFHGEDVMTYDDNPTDPAHGAK